MKYLRTTLLCSNLSKRESMSLYSKTSLQTRKHFPTFWNSLPLDISNFNLPIKTYKKSCDNQCFVIKITVRRFAWSPLQSTIPYHWILGNLLFFQKYVSVGERFYCQGATMKRIYILWMIGDYFLRYFELFAFCSECSLKVSSDILWFVIANYFQ